MSEALKNNTENAGTGGQASKWDSLSKVPFNDMGKMEAAYKERHNIREEYGEKYDNVMAKSDQDFEEYSKLNKLEQIKRHIKGEDPVSRMEVAQAKADAIYRESEQKQAEVEAKYGVDLQEHPDRVTNINKAMMMAQAEDVARDKYSEKINDYRDEASSLEGLALNEQDDSLTSRDRAKMLREAGRFNAKADKLENKIDAAAEKAAERFARGESVTEYINGEEMQG